MAIDEQCFRALLARDLVLCVLICIGLAAAFQKRTRHEIDFEKMKPNQTKPVHV